MLETVAGASPVARASSAWVNDPVAVVRAARRATRCWLAVRSDASTPAQPAGPADGTVRVMAELCTVRPVCRQELNTNAVFSRNSTHFVFNS